MFFKIMLIYVLPRLCNYLLFNSFLYYLSNFFYFYFFKNTNFRLIWKTQIKFYNKLNIIIKKNYLSTSNEKFLFNNFNYVKKNFNYANKNSPFLLYIQKTLKFDANQKKIKNLNKLFFLHTYLNQYLNILKTNKHYLFGSLIWFFSWKFKKNSNLLLLNGQMIVKKKKKSYKKNLKILQKLNKKLNYLKNNHFFKKIYLKNFFFYNKYKIKYYNLMYYIKFLRIKNNKELNKIKNWNLSFFTKPYLFFHKKHNYNKIKKNWIFSFFNIYKKCIKKNKKLKNKSFWLNYWFNNLKYDSVIYAKTCKNFFMFNYLNFSFFNKNVSIFNNKTVNLRFLSRKITKMVNIVWYKKKLFLLKSNNALLFNFHILPVLHYKTLKKIKKLTLKQTYLNLSVKKFKRFKRIYVRTSQCYKLQWNSILNKKNKIFNKNFLKKSFIRYNSKNFKNRLNFKTNYIFKNNFFYSLNNIFFFKIKFKNINNKLNFKYNLNVKQFKTIKNNIYGLLNRPFFKQKKSLNFLTHYNGFLYLSKKIITLKKNNIKTLVNLRKNFYTFSSRYDIHKFVLKAHFKSQFLNEYKIKKKNFKLIENTTIPLFNPKLNLNFNFNENNQANTGLMRFIQPQMTLQKTANQSVSFLEINYLNKNVTNKKISGEVKIKRIKFKPGYRRIWKEARYVLKKVLNLSYRYEHRLTSFLNKQRRFIKLKTLVPFEMTLFNLITYSRIFCYKSFVTLFIENGMIFINGVICCNLKFQMFVNDFIQLIVTIKYYIIYKFLLNYVIKKKLKLKKKIDLRLNFNMKNSEKKKKHHIPDWILFETHHELDVPKYIELDFFTLSIFIIYEPFIIDDFNNLNLHTTKLNVLNLYNWKYIT